MTTETEINPIIKYIFLQEEYGYRHWVGQVPNDMTIEQIIAWWKALPSVMGLFFNPSSSFIVPLYEVEDIADDDAEVCTWSWTDDQGIDHILDRETVIAFFHTHEDDDSYMKVVGGDYHHHAGYGSLPYEEDEEDDEGEDDVLDPLTPEAIEDLKKNHPHIYKALYEDYERAMNERDNKST